MQEADEQSGEKTGEKARLAAWAREDDARRTCIWHAFEPASRKTSRLSSHEEAELTFAPRVDPHSRAVVRERGVVAAVLETLAKASPHGRRCLQAGGHEGRAAAEAAHAAALARRPAGTKEGVCQRRRPTTRVICLDGVARGAWHGAFHEEPSSRDGFPLPAG